MKIFGIILIVIGIVGILLGSMMFGDIGLAAWIGSVTALVTGFGFIRLNKMLINNSKQIEVDKTN